MKRLRLPILVVMILLIGAVKSDAQAFRLPDSVKFKSSFSIQPLKSNYYSCNLGFFCRQEMKLDRITVIPMRFRLGSLNYVNYLEQKPNARIKPF